MEDPENNYVKCCKGSVPNNKNQTKKFVVVKQ